MDRHALQRIFRNATIAALAACGSGCAASVSPAGDGGTADRAPPPPDGPVCTPVPSMPDFCTSQVTYPCNPPAEITTGTALSHDICQRFCPPGSSGSSVIFCNASMRAEGTVLSCASCAIGRRTEGMVEPSAPGVGAVAEHLSRSATLEAGSVVAFERLARELAAFGAPTEWIAALRASAEQERVHAAIVGEAARRYGAEPREPEIAAMGERALEDVALENAVEGCVRETLGALVARWQATHAKETSLREMYARLADDEAEHAAQSWQIDAWAMARLSDAQRAVIARARGEAVEALRCGASESMSDEVKATLGFPDAAAMRAMVDALDRELWSAS